MPFQHEHIASEAGSKEIYRTNQLQFVISSYRLKCKESWYLQRRKSFLRFLWGVQWAGKDVTGIYVQEIQQHRTT